jgi:hypothetical protein
MATTTPNFGWPVPTSTDLVKDGATAIEALGDSIDASLLDLKGGTSGQVLSKNSNTDMDFTWVTSDDANAIQNTIVDAKGDLIAATAADTPARLAVGTNGHVLTADSTAATGIKWAAPAGGGKVLQVVSASTTTVTSVTGTTLTDTNITASITPSSATSKVLVLVAAATQMLSSGSVNQIGMGINLLRGSTVIFDDNATGEGFYITTGYSGYHQAQNLTTINHLDSPATTAATTYKIQIRSNGAANTAKTSDNSRTSSIILMEIGA